MTHFTKTWIIFSTSALTLIPRVRHAIVYSFGRIASRQSVSVTEATEKDLIEAQAESPEVAAQLESLLQYLRAAPTDAPPVRVMIMNPEELKPDDIPENSPHRSGA